MAKINGITQKTQNPFVNLYELDRESKTGKKGKYYVASRAKNQEELKLRTRKNTPDGVIIYSLYGEKQDRVVLVRQYRYALGQELWELPAGKLEKGEDPFEAAKRELAEECGLVAQHYTDLGEFYPTVGYCSEIIYTYLATGLHPVPMHLDEDEFLTPESLPLDEAVAMCLDGRIVDGKTIAALLKIQALRAKGEL